MALSSDELDFMLRESPDSVVIEYGSPKQIVFGVLDRNAVEAQADGDGGFTVVGRGTVLVIRDGSLHDLAQDSTIRVNGTSFKIRDVGTPTSEGTRQITVVEASP
jgi:hypothetical protein